MIMVHVVGGGRRCGSGRATSRAHEERLRRAARAPPPPRPHGDQWGLFPPSIFPSIAVTMIHDIYHAPYGKIGCTGGRDDAPTSRPPEKKEEEEEEEEEEKEEKEKEKEKEKEERGCSFVLPRDVFYRRESTLSRDLNVLIVRVLARARAREHNANREHESRPHPHPHLNRKEKNHLRVLDLLAGSGIRAKRYLAQSPATFVWANDISTAAASAIRTNLDLDLPQSISSASSSSCSSVDSDKDKNEDEDEEDVLRLFGPTRSSPRARWTQWDARRVLAYAQSRDETFDVVDVDAFGTQIALHEEAISIVRDGGYLIGTCTDGLLVGGHRPQVIG